MDFVMPLIALPVTLALWWLGRALRLYPVAANYEGKAIPVAGAALALGILAGLKWHHTVVVMAPWYAAFGTVGVASLAIVAFAALGYVDDRWGDRSASGFGGHIRAALRGRITTGLVKMIGGGVVALACGWALSDGLADGRLWMWLARSAVIALGANAFNLLDTRPARATWAFLCVALVTVPYDLGSPLAAGIGAALAWLPLDRARRAMLGDAGSNVLGAFWGVCFTALARWEAVVAALALLVAFHLYAERRSLNADIAALRLRRMDEVMRG